MGPGGRPPLGAAAGPTWVAVAREAKPPAGRISLDPRDPSSPRSVVGLFFSTTHTKFLARCLARTCTFNFRNEVAGQFEVMAAGLRPMAGNAWGFHADSLVDATSVLSPSRGALTMTGGGSAGSWPGMSCALLRPVWRNAGELSEACANVRAEQHSKRPTISDL